MKICFLLLQYSVLQSFEQGFLNGTCIAKIVEIVSLVKKPT